MSAWSYNPGFASTTQCSSCGREIPRASAAQHSCTTQPPPPNYFRMNTYPYTNNPVAGPTHRDGNAFRAQRPRPQAINSSIASYASVSNDGRITPANSAHGSMSSSSAASGWKSPWRATRFGLKSPSPRPISDELTNLDCAFPPFPGSSSRKPSTSRQRSNRSNGTRDGMPSRNNSSAHDRQAFPRRTSSMMSPSQVQRSPAPWEMSYTPEEHVTITNEHPTSWGMLPTPREGAVVAAQSPATWELPETPEEDAVIGPRSDFNPVSNPVSEQIATSESKRVNNYHLDLDSIFSVLDKSMDFADSNPSSPFGENDAASKDHDYGQSATTTSHHNQLHETDYFSYTNANKDDASINTSPVLPHAHSSNTNSQRVSPHDSLSETTTRKPGIPLLQNLSDRVDVEETGANPSELGTVQPSVEKEVILEMPAEVSTSVPVERTPTRPMTPESVYSCSSSSFASPGSPVAIQKQFPNISEVTSHPSFTPVIVTPDGENEKNTPDTQATSQKFNESPSLQEPQTTPILDNNELQAEKDTRHLSVDSTSSYGSMEFTERSFSSRSSPPPNDELANKLMDSIYSDLLNPHLHETAEADDVKLAPSHTNRNGRSSILVDVPYPIAPTTETESEVLCDTRNESNDYESTIVHSSKSSESTLHEVATPNKGVCRGCSSIILKSQKSVSSADGRLSGRYHKECFVCQTCKQAFPTAEFYVHADQPYCAYHYHELENTLCATCNQGIEGLYMETANLAGRGREKHHPTCLKCSTCRIQLGDDYFEFMGKVYCERDAFRMVNIPRGYDTAPARPSPLIREYISSGDNGLLKGSDFPERRKTRLMTTSPI